jgi:hypothetical protein
VLGAHDASGAPPTSWTYWHGAILHTPWAGRQVAVTVQWGKHGSLPLGAASTSCRAGKTLNAFYAYHWLGPAGHALGRLTRPGPLGFFRSYRRYREFDQPIHLGEHLDAIVVARSPTRCSPPCSAARTRRSPTGRGGHRSPT